MASHNDVGYWLCPDQLFENGVLKHGRALGITEGKVEAVKAQDALPQNVNLKRVAGIISPGFVDLQVNGGGGGQGTDGRRPGPSHKGHGLLLGSRQRQASRGGNRARAHRDGIPGPLLGRNPRNSSEALGAC